MNKEIIRAYAAMRGFSEGEAEADIVRVVGKVARTLAPKYTFGYHTSSDIEQDAHIIALEVLETDAYDPSRPLENFLYVHVKRRLRNNIRKSFHRGEPPCQCCGSSPSPPSPCRKWTDWQKRNQSKRNIMNPIDVANVNDERERGMSSSSRVVEEANLNELLRLIDNRLSIELRADYMRMRENVAVPKARRQRVRDAVLAIMEERRREGK